MHNTVTSQRLIRAGQLATASLLAALLAACASSPMPAPVIDRTAGGMGTAAAPIEPAPPGYYRVKRGDTLYRIALENGQSYRDVAAWNNIVNANQIEVGQLLRIVPPGADVNAATGVATMPVAPAAVQGQPLDQAALPPATTPGANGAAPAGASAPAAAGTSPAAAANGEVQLAWPARGALLGRFDEKGNKGIDISGQRGDAVLAADDGRVIHVGPLRGYGNLVIIKHNETFLTAYGHNDKVVVTEQATVRRGQKIAEMGNTDADRVKLHFEVRRNGKPVDPMRYLPPQ
ncbi:LysM peptidoglycan-binding domain-containing protein [Cupriavidus gilardii]|uniref:peptidoglycan DD-metalloendopeptidase family protein n=1 Tax=Cupriavidus gilardii TaxID=82541 RepID=UPI001571B4D2|nr:peptidoglycan DD-metalloendopeptidase family protein [Cupriavidus gilardii]MCG5262868.1 peptidoglycan DD-metalloendopeptidase family protein [Cupriavidus gilardii]MDF9431393.1 LysM peptidoglycan-binding domain-containing protein [Cupriavidus gilardii]NSX06336.1 peptidoglycan DD-metalloendopeptidase family protein [Cupriavidus gilardii]